ncbi:MAG: hypothetical protein H6838_19865 [Planctomycetes bacterium]|nr:hypothetical protein [Planctomycetota bacterium]
MKSCSDVLQRTEDALAEDLRSSFFGWPSWFRPMVACIWLVWGGYLLARRNLLGERDGVALGIGWVCLGFAILVSERLRIRWLLKRIDATRGARRAVAGAEMEGEA